MNSNVFMEITVELIKKFGERVINYIVVYAGQHNRMHEVCITEDLETIYSEKEKEYIVIAQEFKESIMKVLLIPSATTILLSNRERVNIIITASITFSTDFTLENHSYNQVSMVAGNEQ